MTDSKLPFAVFKTSVHRQVASGKDQTFSLLQPRPAFQNFRSSKLPFDKTAIHSEVSPDERKYGSFDPHPFV